MDKTKILEALKLIKEAFKTSETEKFKEAKLKDGVTIIRYEGDVPAVGMPVMVVTPEGVMPAPDGDHVLEDGTAIKVTGGVIETVTPGAGEAPAPEAAAPGEPKPAAMTEAGAKAIVESIIKETRFAEQIAELKSELAEFKTDKEKFATQKTESETKIKELEGKLEKVSESFGKAVELIEKIAGEPSAQSTENPAPTKKKTAKELSQEFKNALK